MNNLINTDYGLEDIKAKDVIAKDPRDLNGYKIALEYAKECFKITKKFPEWEQDDLADQLRRSTKKIPAQIAEGNGALYSNRELYFIGGIALGSLCESQAHLDVALAYGLVNMDEHKRLDDMAQEIKKLLISYVKAILEEINKKSGDK